MKIALTIAGFDPSGGAGLQADLKTFEAFGVYGASVMTCLAVQNSKKFLYAKPVTVKQFTDQLDAVLTDLPVSVIKVGMLSDAKFIPPLVKRILIHRLPMVLDPVLRATLSGGKLDKTLIKTMREIILPHIILLTPNLQELAGLSGIAVKDSSTREKAAKKLLALGAQAVLVKGGHSDEPAVDYLYKGNEQFIFVGKTVVQADKHGTGCALSAAITAGLAQGVSLEKSIERAKRYLEKAIKKAPSFGQNYGPLRHSCTNK